MRGLIVRPYGDAAPLRVVLDRNGTQLFKSASQVQRRCRWAAPNGTASLYVALDVKTCKVQGMTAARHTTQISTVIVVQFHG